MLHFKDVHPENGSFSYEISLARLVEKPIADVYGYVANEFGEPSFKLTRIAFADGTSVDVEGEHDFPYVSEVGSGQPNLDSETLARLDEECNRT